MILIQSPKLLIRIIVMIIAFSVSLSILQAQVSGTAFRDYNNNGLQDINASYKEPGIKGIIVNAFNTGNQIIASYETDPQGNYLIPQNGSVYNGIPGSNTGSVLPGQIIRLEFNIPNAVADVCGLDSGVDYTGYNGNVYGTSVQFVMGGASNINFAINNPSEFRQPNLPNVFIPCYVNGDPLAGGNSGTAEWFVSFPYSNTGTQMPTDKLNGQVLGAVYGVAFSKQAKKVFTSAFLKRHVGLGQMGSGGIYAINYNSNGTFGAISQFYDLDANDIPTRYNNSRIVMDYGEGSSYTISNPGQLNQETITYLGEIDPVSGLPEGLGVIGSNSERGLSPDKSVESYDPAAYGQVGKVGLGDMAISDDGRFLFVTNLYSRKIVRLELNNPYNPTAVISILEINIPDVSCNDGLLRPFALKYHRDKLLLGAVCSGEFGGENNVNGVTDLYAYVFELNVTADATPTWSNEPLVTFPLNYLKGPSFTLSCPNTSKWKPWTNTFSTICSHVNFRLVYEQPILSGISFDSNGDMILGFTDRMGHMAGGGNLGLKQIGEPEDEQTLYFVSTGGDLLKVFIDEHQPCSFRLEEATDRTAAQNNNQGPDGGEFFYQDNFSNHHETAQGAIIIVPGTGEVTSTVMDPFAINSGGLRWFSEETGQTIRNYQLYIGVGNVGLLGKANGLGAMDFSSVEPNLEIGNRIWLDSNLDGIQDANESGLDGLLVELFTNGTKVGETTTDNGGEYYFNLENVNLNGANGLLAFTEYEIRVELGQVGIENLELTTQFATSPGNSEVRDSDAFESDGFAVIEYTTGAMGHNDHTLDIGFRPEAPDQCVLEIVEIEVLPCVPLTNTYSISVTVTYANPTGETININGEIFSLSSMTGATESFVLEGLVANGQTNIPVVAFITGECQANAQYDAPEPCTPTCTLFINQVSVGDCDPETNTYDLSITMLWTNAASDVIEINGEMFFINGGMGSSNTQTFTLENLVANGQTGISVSAFFPGSDCGEVLDNAYDAPENCEPICTLVIDQIQVSVCDPVTNTYVVSVTVSWTEAPGSSIEINGEVFAIVGTSGTETFVLEGLIANGQTGLSVSAIFPGTDCSDIISDAYDAPENCEPVCTLVIDQILVSDCDPLTNTYNLSVTVSWTEAPGSSIEINGELFAIVGTSGTETFVLEGLIANGQNGLSVTAIFPGTDCEDEISNAYNAPENCEPVCSLAILSAIPSACEPFTETYMLFVEVSYANLEENEIEINGISFMTASSTGIETFIINDLVADGEEGISIYIEVKGFPECFFLLEDAYDAPEACEPMCPEDYSIIEDDIIFDVFDIWSLPICIEGEFVQIPVCIVEPCVGFFIPDAMNADFNGLDFSIVEVTENCITYEVFLIPGDYNWEVTYTNPNGTTVSLSHEVTVDNMVDELAQVFISGSQNFTLPYCEELMTEMIVVISDDCYEDVIPEKAVFTLCGESITFDSFDPTTGTFVFSFAVTADIHLCEFRAEYEDFSGNIVFDVRTLAVNYTDDTVGPIIIYPSNDISLSIDECEADELEFCFHVSASDNCDGIIIPVVIINGQIIQPVPGTNTYCVTLAEEGNYYVFIEATDSSDNVTQEDFNIDVTEGQVVPDNLGCIASLNVSLNDECLVTITPEMLLTGSFACLPPSYFNISIYNDENSFDNQVDTCGLFIYEISLAEGVLSNFESCWGNILIEDKTPPLLECIDGSIECDDIDALLNATSLEDLLVLGIELPVVTDNCGVASLSYTVGPLSSIEMCEDRTIIITFRATDICGNTAQCDAVITILQDQLADICEGLQNYDGIDQPAFDCEGTWAIDSNGNPHPSVTGMPLKQNCNIQCSYIDINVPICGPGSEARKILRRWICVDWCLPNNQVQECTQVLKIKDDQGPIMAIHPPNFLWQRHYGCEYNVRFSRPTVFDVCSDLVSISVKGPGFYGEFFNSQTGINIDVFPRNTPPQPIPNPINLPIGEHIITYSAIDACGNITEVEDLLILRDNHAPIAICETFRVASLDNNCRVRIFAESFNDGSYDVCGLDRFTVRRMNPSPCYSPQSAALAEAPHVDFCCADIGTSQDQRTVIFRVYDAAGNTNECMVFVEVQDKLLPTIVCPPNITIDCRFHFGETDEELAEAFGRIILPTEQQPNPSFNPDRRVRPELYDGFPWVSTNRSGYINVAGEYLDGYANDNCSNAFASCFLEVTVNNAISLECRQGAPNTQGKPFGIRRTFTVRDAAGNTTVCTQFITVTNLFPFMGGTETFPGFYVGGALDRGYYRVFRQPQGTVAQINNALSLLNGWPTDAHAVPSGPYEGGESVNPNPSGPLGIDNKVRYRVRPVNTVYPTRWDIVWPADLMVIECRHGIHPDSLAKDGLYRVGSKPFIEREDLCAQVGMTYDEWEFDFDAGCKKIIRRWKVIDWCQEHTILNPWMWDQLIKVVDTEGPEITFGEYDPCTLDICNSDLSFPVTLTASATDDCLDDGLQIRWSVEIWVNGNSGDVITSNSLSISHSAQGNVGIITVSGSFPLTAPGSVHKVKFIAEDGCGNKSTALYDFEVRECKKPTPVCFDGLATDLMPIEVPMVEVEAVFFNAGSYDNCTPHNELRYRLGRDVSTGQTSPPSTTSLIFTCQDIGLVPVAMWVGDNYNNWDYCITYILVQNNMGAECEEDTLGFTVNGWIANMFDQPLSSVELRSSINDHLYSTTSTDGKYEFKINENTALLMYPYLEGDPKSGLSTLDLLLMQRHILGIEKMENPYKYIAADVDRSGSINAKDMIEIRRLILGKTYEFSNNKTWRFVKRDIQFEQPHSALSMYLAESINVLKVTNDMLGEDFIGIKIGDVSLKPDGDSLVDVQSRFEPFVMTASNQILNGGKVYAIEIKGSQIEQFQGLQFTMDFDETAIEFDKAEPGILNVIAENLGLHEIQNGKLTFSWNGIHGVEINENEVLFTLYFKSIRDGMIKDYLGVNSSITQALAVIDFKEVNTSLIYLDDMVKVSFELFQNQPNPFSSETSISFNLPYDMEASIIIYDMHGRMIQSIDGFYRKGFNNVNVLRNNLPSNTVLYYQLSTEEFNASRKMIIMD